MSLPKTMRALTLVGTSASIQSIPLPAPRSTHLLIKVTSVALNPTDWKHIAGGIGSSPFSIVGCDYAGEVISIGADVTKSFAIGDKVYGCAHGSNFSQPYDGIFAEYAVVKGDVAMHVPSGTKAEDVVSVSLGAITVGQGLFQKDKGIELELPEQGKGNGEWVLIYGGSTATGSLAIQFAKLAGYKVITTCSSKHNEFVKEIGADAVFDYNDPDCAKKIRELTENKLRLAWDTISLEASAKICGEALSSDGSDLRYGEILWQGLARKDVKQTATIMYTMFGEEFEKGSKTYPASEQDWEFGKMWMGITEKLVREGKIKPHPKRLGNDGLEGIQNGLDDLKANKVSGQKVVYIL